MARTLSSMFPLCISLMLLSSCSSGHRATSSQKNFVSGDLHIGAVVDIVQLFQEEAVGRDSIFHRVCAATRSEASTSTANVVPIFLRQFQVIATSKGKVLADYFSHPGLAVNDDVHIWTYLQRLADSAVEFDLAILQNRVDQMGISDVKIEKRGARGVVIEVSDAGDTSSLRRLLLSRGRLEFCLMKDPGVAATILERIDNYLAAESLPKGDPDKERLRELAKVTGGKSSIDSARMADSLSYSGLSREQGIAKYTREHPFMVLMTKGMDPKTGRVYVAESDRNEIQKILARPDIRQLYPDEMNISFSRPLPSENSGENFYEVYFLNSKAELTGKTITDVRAEVTQKNGAPDLLLQMDDVGSIRWKEVTGANINKQIAIVLDGTVYSAPVVRAAIYGGSTQITEAGTMGEALMLAAILKAGELPAPLQAVSFEILR